MYRILIVDDERIVIEAVRNIIYKNFPGKFEVAIAESGITAVSQAGYFHPDIVFMDIHMPDINGIEALKKIRGFNRDTLFYIISACDKFDYARQAIQIGVEAYLLKPVTKEKLIEVIQNAIDKVENSRRIYELQQEIEEKLEAVIPIAENWFVSSAIFQRNWKHNEYFRSLLDLYDEYGYVCVFQFEMKKEESVYAAEEIEGLLVKGFYEEFRAIVKSYIHCLIGNVISDCIVVIVPHQKATIDTEEENQIIELLRQLAGRLEESIKLHFRIGVGSVQKLEEISISFHDASIALKRSSGDIAHMGDLGYKDVYEEESPSEVENKLLQMLEHGDEEGAYEAGNLLFDWIISSCHQDISDIRMKVLEYVVWIEQEKLRETGMNYMFSLNKSYAKEVKHIYDFEQLRTWFFNRCNIACNGNKTRKNEQSVTVVSKAKDYIRENYQKDITLEDVARQVNVSPYYFSKLFKEESGENFIDYLTRVRIDIAVKLLRDRGKSIKEISLETGYADPNYFSRLFKKRTGMTPKEYRNNK